MAIICRYEHMICHLIMQMLATKSWVDSTTQHNTTQPNTTAISSRGENVFPTTNSEGGIYLHVFRR